VVLKDPAKMSVDKENELIEYCRKHLIKWSCPREIEFRKSLPITLIGKVAYKVLEEEEIEKLKAAGKYSGEK
jgi:long-chain acyl-CoA synthetase